MICFKRELGNASKVGFIMSAVALSRCVLVENQCMVVLPGNEKKLDPLIHSIAQAAAADYDALHLEVENELEFLSSQTNRELNRSLFTSGLHQQLLDAYIYRNHELFADVNDEIFGGQLHSGYTKNPYSGIITSKQNTLIEKPNMLSRGERHWAYKYTGRITYKMATDFFKDKLRLSVEEYLRTYWRTFTSHFDSASLAQQFQFENDMDEPVGMYSWANPGYSRLTALEKAAGTVKAKYLEKHELIPKVVILRLVFSLQQAVPRGLSSAGELSTLYQKVRDISRACISRDNAVLLLKELLLAIVSKDSVNIETENVLVGHLVRQLNANPQYSLLRKLITPDKEKIDLNDLDGFFRS